MTTAPPPSTSGIDLYTVPTPNGLKISVALAELEEGGSPIKFTEHKINMQANEQKEEWFLALNPNGRIPLVVDRDRDDFVVWESASILLYFAKYYDPKFIIHPKEDKLYDEMLNWIFFSHGGTGPMLGQANVFVGGAGGNLVFPAQRYINESMRLLSVYEDRLSGKRETAASTATVERDYLVGEGKGVFSIADIVAFTWARAHVMIGHPHLTDLPHTAKWLARIEERPGTKKAVAGGMLEKFKSDPNWEENSRKRTEWVWKKDETKPKDEL